MHIYPISGATGEGVKELMDAVLAELQTLPAPEPLEREMQVEEWDEPDTYAIEEKEGVFRVEGSLAEKIVAETYFDDYEALRYFQQRLINTGIVAALRAKGAKEGDTVVMSGVEFDFVE
ncbi:hypothetical protein FACS189415_6450 [Bacteroidia bacterium]|nr:hypothetical protein FACS189415_6450 [Bacteroidia bacterium]